MFRWLKSLFVRKRPAQKRVLEKVSITKPFKKKRYTGAKKEENNVKNS